eukprot:781139_1
MMLADRSRQKKVRAEMRRLAKTIKVLKNKLGEMVSRYHELADEYKSIELRVSQRSSILGMPTDLLTPILAYLQFEEICEFRATSKSIAACVLTAYSKSRSVKFIAATKPALLKFAEFVNISPFYNVKVIRATLGLESYLTT